jgi:hypothetical protein
MLTSVEETRIRDGLRECIFDTFQACLMILQTGEGCQPRQSVAIPRSSANFKGILLKRGFTRGRPRLRVHDATLISADDANPSRTTRRITRSAERQISSGWLYIFICESALVSKSSGRVPELSFPVPLPVVSALIGIIPNARPRTYPSFPLPEDAHKIKFTKRREFRVPMTRVRVDHGPSSDIRRSPRVLLPENVTKRNDSTGVRVEREREVTVVPRVVP